MKPKDLRIGNIINFNGIPLAVGELSNKNFDEWYVVFSPEDPLIRNFKAKGINPEPLTEEWLVKFGFEDQSGGWGGNQGSEKHYKKATLEIQTFGDSYSKWMMVKMNSVQIYYVHQLQNLYFAMTGKELTLSGS
jgi:hypothetical protein